LAKEKNSTYIIATSRGRGTRREAREIAHISTQETRSTKKKKKEGRRIPHCSKEIEFARERECHDGGDSSGT